MGIEIIENQCYEAYNLISVRKKINQIELQKMIINLLEYIKSHGASKVAPIISATYSIDPSSNLMDTEIFIPVNMTLPSTEDFLFKPRLYLDNCVKITHKGNPQMLQNTCNLLNDYIAVNKLTPISCGFNVTKTEIATMEESNKFEVDIYVSISRNVI